MNCRDALATILDSVDYTAANCRPNEMVGAVLPKEMIVMARGAIAEFDRSIAKGLEIANEVYEKYSGNLTQDAADLPCGYPGCDDIGWNGGFCRLHNPANTANR